jgi:GTP-binding protein YchF
MDVALIGLASSGKTSLQKALAAGHLPAHSNPSEPAMAVVKVPDERLDRLATLVEAKKTNYLELKILDFPSFSIGKKGPPPALLGTLATADMLVHVVHAFDSPAVPHPLDSVDPARDIAAMDLELAFADLAIVERRIERLTAEMRSLAAGQRANQERELALMNRIRQALENETPVRAMGLTSEEELMLSGFNLISAKPLLIVLNIAEADAPRTEEIEAEARGTFEGRNTAVIALCARSEADVAELPPEEAEEFRKELGLPEKHAPERVLQAAVTLLGLITFYTAGPQDTHAWSIPGGLPATKAAGRIHSDIERGFIRAEVIGWQELLDVGSHAEAKKRGTMRVEGKTYEVQDGDVINVLFNV